MAPKLPQGVDGLPPPVLPQTYEGFRQWYPQYILQILKNADVRNATSGFGISVGGTPVTPGTLAVSAPVTTLFSQEYLLAPGATSSVLTDYRTLAAEAGVLSLADGGAESALTVSVVANGIGNIQIRQGAAASVIGNAASALANVADIAASVDGQVLQRSSGTLSFAALSSANLAAIAADTLLGNNTASPAAPAAITVAQTKTLLDYAVGDLAPIANNTIVGNTSGVSAAPAALATVGAAAGVALADTGTWTPTVFGSTAAGSTTYTLQAGGYTRLGDVVHFFGRVKWTAVTGTGNFRIGGLPFTCRASATLNTDYPVSCYVNGSLTVIQAMIVLAGTETIECDEFTVGTAASQPQALPSAGDVMISGFYAI